jgi:sulfate adenylyltransferase
MPQTATQGSTLIAPHGGTLVDRTVNGDDASALAEEAGRLPRVRLTEKQTADLDMIASGALSPLTGFMTRDDYTATVEDMHLASGLAWALPVTLAVETQPQGDRLALEGYEGGLLAVLDVAEVFEADRQNEAAKVFRTTEEAHPGVAQVYAEGSTLVGGPPGAACGPGPDPRRLRRARLEPRRRLPDPKPRPPRARVHPEVCLGDGRRPAPAPVGRQDQG